MPESVIGSCRERPSARLPRRTSLLQNLVIREERQAVRESRNVHDGHGRRHLGRGREEGEFGHLAVGGAGILLRLLAAVLVVLLGAKPHHLHEQAGRVRTGKRPTCTRRHGGSAYVHAEFAAPLPTMFLEPGGELGPAHLLQGLDLDRERRGLRWARVGMKRFGSGVSGVLVRTPSLDLRMKHSVGFSLPRRHAAKGDKRWQKGDASKSGPVGAERAEMKRSGK